MNETRPTYFEIFGLFLKIGALGFGGPYALLLFLEKEVVERKKWLSPETFWEGVAVGQLTPGPIFLATAVFCGYRLRGLLGAYIAIVASAFPAFVLAIVFGYFYSYFQKFAQLNEILSLVLAVVVGLLFSVLWKDRKKFFGARSQLLIGVVVFAALFFFHLNPLLVMLGAGIFGALFFAGAKTA